MQGLLKMPRDRKLSGQVSFLPMDVCKRPHTCKGGIIWKDLGLRSAKMIQKAVFSTILQ